MRLKKEYVILFGIIIVLLVYIIFSSNRNKMTYKVPKLDRIENSEIDRIEISKAGEEIILSGKGDVWKIMPQEYPADYDKVKGMLDVIGNLTLTELSAEKKDYLRYELDEAKKIVVKAFKGDQLLREFDIGKPSSTYSHTFVRVGKDPCVYHARNSFRSTFDQDKKDLRDNVVMKFDKNEITGIEIKAGVETYELARKMMPLEIQPEEQRDKDQPSAPKEEESWVMPDGKKAQKTEIDSLLSQLSNLKCDEFIEGKVAEDFKDPLYSVTLKGNKDYILRIFKKEKEEDDKYPALSSEISYPLLLSSYNAEKIMKKPEDFLKEE
ncbi:MAG TPA: DUF4340 domain-containing protein [Thermoplasmata archaeon]|nr:DUF4340 domain-containing protein [Thermoplasmata archaeon]